jgi:hypothetical protein
MPIPRSLITVLGACLAAAIFAAGTSAAPAKKIVPVTFIGDSVAASILYTPQAQTILSRGLKVRFDLRVCRRLVAASCAYQGSAPPTALQSVQSLDRSVGQVLVVNVGYNESAVGYGKGVDQVMRSALAQGARHVVWVTLREQRDTYRWTNVAIRTAAKRWPQLRVAEWNAYSRNKPWFSSDGLHMSSTGATELARYVRTNVLAASS